MRPFVVVAALAAIVVAATPAFAQNVNRDTVTIGVGGAIVPRYEGANDYELSPAAAIRGRVSGIGFSTLGTSLFVDLIAPPAESTTGKLVLGPAARLGLSRSSTRRTRDPQIVALGRVPVSVEVGGHIGYSKTGVITSDFDNLSFDLAVLHDVTDVHRSAVVTPSINYGTPLSRKAFVGASVSATHVGDGYARRYFGVSPAQSLASGLRRYTPGSGFKARLPISHSPAICWVDCRCSASAAIRGCSVTSAVRRWCAIAISGSAPSGSLIPSDERFRQRAEPRRTVAD